MLKSFLIGMVAAIATASTALGGTIGFADPNPLTGPAGDHPAPFQFRAGSGTWRIDVVVTGGDLIRSADITAGLGDGGPILGGTDTSPPLPVLSNLRLLSNDPFATPPSDGVSRVFLSTDGESPVLTFGTLVQYRNATGTALRTATGILGSFDLNFAAATAAGAQTRVSLLSFPDTTDVLNDANQDLQYTLGTQSLSILVPIPEPATALLLIGALPFLRRRRTA